MIGRNGIGITTRREDVCFEIVGGTGRGSRSSGARIVLRLGTRHPELFSQNLVPDKLNTSKTRYASHDATPNVAVAGSHML